jgi:hypothetical protein
MVANFRNKIFMQPMKSNIMELKGFPIFLVGEGKGGLSFFKLCLVWRVDYQLFHFPLGEWDSMQGVFFFWVLICFVLGKRGEALKAKSSRVCDMFPKEFLVGPHFYSVCFGKSCPPFTYIGVPKARNSILKIKPFIWGATII